MKSSSGALVCTFYLMLFLSPTAIRGADRTYNGAGNNEFHPEWGAAGTPLARHSDADYSDGKSIPAGAGRASPRAISNAIANQAFMAPDPYNMSSWVFQWGQFIDHDLDLTGSAAPPELFPISIPTGDPIFDPGHTGTQTMMFMRSKYDPSTGTSASNPRQQINEITSYLDGSMVYGSDEGRALALRSSGGKLKTSAGGLLPFNTLGLPNGTGGHPDPTAFYVAGDVRANEQIGLTAAHTLFVREHNRIADELAAANPTWDDEQVFQRARKIVGAEIQAITFYEFLPALLGPYAPSPHGTYDPAVNASIMNEFSTALFRVGHTMLPPELLRIRNDGTPAPEGPIALRDAFFQPGNLGSSAELEYILKGLATQCQQRVDSMVVDDVRNFLFGEPLAGGFDLASLNIQRGRDHGLPDYNRLRVAFGLLPVGSFADITSDPGLQAALASVYPSVDDIDAWVGALAEDHLPGAAAGELVVTVLADQFTRLRDGDRFWYEHDPDFSAADIAALSQTRLSDVIRRNTGITNLQVNVFYAIPEPSTMALAAVPLVLLAVRRWRRR
jgi:hypothetical protein